MRFLFGVCLTPASHPIGLPVRLCEAMAQRALPGRTVAILSPPNSSAAFAACPLSPSYPAEAQPTTPAIDQRTATLVVADLRLDNRVELARALDLDSSPDMHLTDSDLLLRAWSRWRERCVDHLSGAFAFVCWEYASQTLFLARDPSGEKPLFHAERAGLFAFASMPGALLALPGAGSRLEEERIAEYLAGCDPSRSGTFFPGIHRLPRGSCLLVGPERTEERRFWTPARVSPIRYARDAEYLEDFRERFDRATALALSGARRIGSQLSSGLDSSAVTATAALVLGRRGERLTAFTARPLPELPPLQWPGRFADEGPAAAEVAALHPNLDHVFLNAAGRDMVATLKQAARAFDAPAYNVINHLWSARMLDLCRERGITVLLCGAGGNGTISFDGMAYFHELFRAARWVRLARRARDLRANGYLSWRGAARWALGPAVPSGWRRLMPGSRAVTALPYSPLNPEIERKYRLSKRVFEQSYRREVSVRSMLRDYYETYDPGTVNLATALEWGIEYRDPTQDKAVVEFCLGIPPEQYTSGGETRSLLRRAMADRLPESTLRRTDRGIQSADWYLIMGPQLDRLRAELARTDKSPLARRLLDLPRLRALLDSWPAKGWEQVDVSDSYHLALTRGLAAGRFLTMHDPDFPSQR
jgi:asparagine synthase (glutamine-hydrolysing)